MPGHDARPATHSDAGENGPQESAAGRHGTTAGCSISAAGSPDGGNPETGHLLKLLRSRALWRLWVPWGQVNPSPSPLGLPLCATWAVLVPRGLPGPLGCRPLYHRRLLPLRPGPLRRWRAVLAVLEAKAGLIAMPLATTGLAHA